MYEKINEILEQPPIVAFELWNKLGSIQIKQIAERTIEPINLDLNLFDIKEVNKLGIPDTYKKG